MAKAVKTEKARLYTFENTRHLERSFNPCIDCKSNSTPFFDEGAFLQTVGCRRFRKSSSVFIIGRAKSEPGDDREPSEIGMRKKNLMKRVEPESVVIRVICASQQVLVEIICS